MNAMQQTMALLTISEPLRELGCTDRTEIAARELERRCTVDSSANCAILSCVTEPHVAVWPQVHQCYGIMVPDL